VLVQKFKARRGKWPRMGAYTITLGMTGEERLLSLVDFGLGIGAAFIVAKLMY
jgi:hypothetical protein